MTLKVIQDRGALPRTKAALAKGAVTVGFLGGSITDSRVGYNWPEPVVAWLAANYSGVRITVENAAIGATGSDSAVFRADRDIIARGCDLVFVEYAVNDSGTPPVTRARSREGLLRKLIASGADVVIVYTFSSDMYADMSAGLMPPTVADFEALAEHYGLPSVWMGLHALGQLDLGLMRWYEWLPDNLHPQYRGSQVYADSVNDYLQVALSRDDAAKPAAAMPAPLDAVHWEAARAIPVYDVTLTGPWTIRRWNSHSWFDLTLESSAPGSKLSVPFAGRVLWMCLDFGRRTCSFRWRVDGGEWRPGGLECPTWCGDSGWPRAVLLTDELAPGPHRFELETVLDNATTTNGSDFKIGIIGHVPGD